MAIADIVAKITSDAEKEAATILSSAQDKAAEILAKARKDADESVLLIEKKGQEKIGQLRKKVDNLALHEEKSKILREKRTVLDAVFERAKEKMKSMPRAEKERILTAMFSQIESPSGTVHPVRGDEDIVRSVMEKSGKTYQIGTSESGVGGFRFISNDIEMDFRFDMIISRELAKKMEREVSDILFS